jgi:predicted transcriptional regulator
LDKVFSFTSVFDLITFARLSLASCSAVFWSTTFLLAAKAELKAASKKVVDQKTALQEAKDNLAKVIKSNTEVKEKTLSKKAVLAAKVKGEQRIGTCV